MSIKLEDISIHSLGEEFLKEWRAGALDSAEDFAARFPERRDELLQFLSKLMLIEGFFQDASSQTTAVPEEIGPYSICKEIGRGGMGIVCSATHPALGNALAIKLLPVGKFNEKNLRRFNLEAKTCAALDHPNIVPVFDYGLNEEFAFFAMKRVHGRSLAEIISAEEAGQKHELTWHQIGEIGKQAASALEYAHEQHVIHRDIKPANMLFGDDGKLWLTDFGLAKLGADSESRQSITQGLTETGDVVGTVRYMAPERFRGICSEASDVFGLGLTLYELVAGRRLENGHELFKDAEAVGLPDLKTVNPQAPDSLCQIIMKACQFQPEERYQSAKELHFVLSRFCEGVQRAERRSVRNTSRSRWRRRDYLIGASIFTMLATGAAITWVFQEAQKRRKASAQDVAEVLDNHINMGSLWQKFSQEGPEGREKLATVLKPMVCDVPGVPADKLEQLSEVFDQLSRTESSCQVPKQRMSTNSMLWLDCLANLRRAKCGKTRRT